MNIKKIHFIWIACLILTGCAQPQNPLAIDNGYDGSTSTDKQTTPIVGRWQLERITQDKININKPSPYGDWHQIQVVFGADGTLDGTSSSNSLTGSRYTIADSSAIALSIFQTKVGESAWGYSFINIVRQAVRYHQSSDTLRLYDGRNNELLFKHIGK